MIPEFIKHFSAALRSYKVLKHVICKEQYVFVFVDT